MGHCKMESATTHRGVQGFWEPGFTLLEVMGAVMILAFFVISLSGSNVAGIRLETEAQRRTEAAELANTTIAQLELEISQQSASLETDFIAEEAGSFTIESEIFEYLVELPTLDTDDPEEDSAAAYNSGMEERNPIRMIQVRVFWEDRGRAMMVQRTTFAVDQGSMGVMGGDALEGGGMGIPGLNAPQSPESTP